MPKITDKIKNAKVNMPCPQCGHLLKASLQDAISEKQITCPNCGAAIQLKQKDNLAASLSQIEKELKQRKLK